MLQEEAQYLARIFKAAVTLEANLVPCARAACEGAAISGRVACHSIFCS